MKGVFSMSTAVSRHHLRTLDLAYIALFAGLIAVCAWITVPAAVPFTMQTFGICAALFVLGGRRGTWAVGVYLLLGFVGLPVFSGFQGGPGTLLGTTGGYILGFFAMAAVYWLITAWLGEKLPVSILAMVLGLLVCYVFGAIWFMVLYARNSGPIGLATALGWCVFPFVIPDLAKLALAALLARRVSRFLR